MKEIMAVIRMDMINRTKDVLLAEGFSSMNCRKVMGRGKKKVDLSMPEGAVSGTIEIDAAKAVEVLSEGHRLLPKRLISLVVKDDEVNKAVDLIMSENCKGKQGDGKIFILPIYDAIRIRTGENGDSAI